MKILKIVGFIALLLVTGLLAFWCGVGSLFVLGDKDPKYHTQGLMMVAVAVASLVIFIASLTGFIRALDATGAPPNASE